MANHSPNGKFAPGNRANPGGRPKIVDELRQRALRAVDEKVLAAWEDELEERDRQVVTQVGAITVFCKGPNWVKCSELLAAYGLGKPVQPVESKVEVTVSDTRQMTTAQLDARIAELEGSHVEH